jgi:TolB-like protein
MIYSTNFLSRARICLITVGVCIFACTPANDFAGKVKDHSVVLEKKLRIAVMPFTNLSGTPAPVRDMRRLLLESLQINGADLLEEKDLETFVIKHRLRYVGGIDKTVANDLKWETGADAVLVTTLELYSEEVPPKISLLCRLISTGKNPTILWMDGMGSAGNDSIGFLELSLIKDPQILVRNAIRRLTLSLMGNLSSGEDKIQRPEGKVRFWPFTYYRSPILEPGESYKIAVVPFFDLSDTRGAGEIIALHFVKQLSMLKSFSVVEPGVVRQALLRYRIIQDDGLSVAQAEILFSKLNVDLVLNGTILDYQDYRGGEGKPIVDFSAVMQERKSREIVWACESQHQGDDGVFFFDWGKIHTAHRMASLMVNSALSTFFE